MYRIRQKRIACRISRSACWRYYPASRHQMVRRGWRPDQRHRRYRCGHVGSIGGRPLCMRDPPRLRQLPHRGAGPAEHRRESSACERGLASRASSQPSKVAIAGSLQRSSGSRQGVQARKERSVAAARRIPRRGRDRGAVTARTPPATPFTRHLQFAVARGSSTIREAKLDPGGGPLRVPEAAGICAHAQA